MKNLLIKLLIKLIDVPASKTGDYTPDALDFLGNAWQTKGFQDFFAERNRRHMFELSGGSMLTEPTREGYSRVLGQRVEMLILARLAKAQYDKVKKEKSQKKG